MQHFKTKEHVKKSTFIKISKSVPLQKYKDLLDTIAKIIYLYHIGINPRIDSKLFTRNKIQNNLNNLEQYL